MTPQTPETAGGKVEEDLREIFASALDAAEPGAAVLRALTLTGGVLACGSARYDLKAFERVMVIGAGKGTAPMAVAVEGLLGEKVSSGVIVVKYGHARGLKRIRQVEAAHPVPDEAGVRGTAELLKLLEATDEKTLVICLVSGGASSLLVRPAEGLTLGEVQATTGLLLASGAEINEVNSVRKHISAVKGGRLAEAASPATLLTLIVSDVLGDRIDTIGSGPTAPDPSTYGDALEILTKYGITQKIPRGVLDVLERGAAGRIKETPKGKEPFFEKTLNVIVANNAGALAAARERAGALGYRVEPLTAALAGPALEAAAFLAGRAREAQKGLKPDQPPVCLVSGGETTVVVTGPGRGGRNQELALAFALDVEGFCGITLLSAGTDGTDGPTDAAGAIVSTRTIPLARSLSIDPEAHLAANDSYTFFKRLDTSAGTGAHLKTGPTGTNVMDLQLVIVRAAT